MHVERGSIAIFNFEEYVPELEICSKGTDPDSAGEVYIREKHR